MSKRGLSGDEEDVDVPTGGGEDGKDKRARTAPSTALVAVDTSTAIIQSVLAPVRGVFLPFLQPPVPRAPLCCRWECGGAPRRVYAAVLVWAPGLMGCLSVACSQGGRTSELKAPVMQLLGHTVRWAVCALMLCLAWARLSDKGRGACEWSLASIWNVSVGVRGARRPRFLSMCYVSPMSCVGISCAFPFSLHTGPLFVSLIPFSARRPVSCVYVCFV